MDQTSITSSGENVIDIQENDGQSGGIFTSNGNIYIPSQSAASSTTTSQGQSDVFETVAESSDASGNKTNIYITSSTPQARPTLPTSQHSSPKDSRPSQTSNCDTDSDVTSSHSQTNAYSGLQQSDIITSATSGPVFPSVQSADTSEASYSPVVAAVVQVPSGNQGQTPTYMINVKQIQDMVQIDTVSESDPGDAVKVSQQGQLMSCLVCGDKGSGYHYSVFSCEGCKGFFKRTVQKNLVYNCKDQQNCSINKFTRNSCQACRFQKCQEMGMKREAVREDRSPGGKHRSKRPRLSGDDMSAYAVGGDGGLDYAPDVDTNSEFSDRLVEGLVVAKPDLIPRFDGNTGLQSLGINEMMQFGYAELKFIIDWAKKVPGFSDFGLEDQMALLKASFMELNVLRLAYRSMMYTDAIKFAEGFVVPVEVAKGLGWGKDLTSATLEFSQRLRDIDIDLVEFCILNGIVLTYPDASGVKDKHSIVNLQNKMLGGLRRYMSHNYPDDQRRYGKMLLRLPSLRTVSAKAAERFLSLTLDGSIQLSDLVLEMIN